MKISSWACACLMGALLPADIASATPTQTDGQQLIEALQPYCIAARAWDQPLCGKTLVVHPQTRTFVEIDLAAGTIGDTGNWPADRIVANTSVTWKGEAWAMVMWPLPGEAKARAALVLHENFHRVEPLLPFNAGSYTPANHLDSVMGRTSLRLELLMLAKAVEAEAPGVRRAYADAAYSYRADRLLSDQGRSAERHLNIKEGTAEYIALEAVYRDEVAAQIAAALRTAEQGHSFIRSFAYSTGPAWLYLLDQDYPDWRTAFNGETGFADLYQRSVLAADKSSLTVSGALKNRILAEEEERAAAAERERQSYLARFVTGPAIRLPQGAFSFDPNTAVALGDHGTVYRTFGMKGPWGAFETEKGALISSDYSKVTVDYIGTAGTPEMENDFWTLRLNQGWRMVMREGLYRIEPTEP